MSLKTFALKIGNELFKVKGLVNPKGWLEWKSADGSSGISMAEKFCAWGERKKHFPDCTDNKD